MQTYKYDTHVHTSQTSPCGRIPAERLVQMYKAAGYQGAIITDHYFDEYFEYMDCKEWKQKVNRFLEGYRAALCEGQKIGFDIILGMELRFQENLNDYLVYGFDESFLFGNKELYKLGLNKFRQLVKGMDILIYQAHPFRSWVNQADPELLDGVEVFNGSHQFDSLNHKAYGFAEDNGLKMISGSDFHNEQDLARGGIVIPERIGTPKELVYVLNENRIIELIAREECVRS